MSYPTSTNETFKVGDRVFAKIRGYQHWPAQVTERVGGPNEEYCVAFYGTHEIAYVKPPMMCHYDEESIEKYASPPVSAGKKRKPSRSHVLMLQKAMEECASAVNFIPCDVDEQNNVGVGMVVDGLKEGVLDEEESQVESPINESVKEEIFEKTLSPDTLISKRSRSVKPKAGNIVKKTQSDEKIQSVAVTSEYPDQEIIQNVQGHSTPRLVLEEEKASVMCELPRANLMLSELNDANNSKVSRSGRKIKLKRFADEVDSSPFAEHLKATLKSSQVLSPKKRKSSLDENVQQAKKLSLDPEVAGKSDPGVKRQKSFSTDDQIKSPPVEPPLVFAKKSAPVLEENPIREPSSATSDITPDQTPGRRTGRPSKNRFLTNVPNLPSPSQLPASISWKVEAMKPLQDKLITSCKRLESLHAKEGESVISAPIREKLVAASTPTVAVLSVALPPLSGSISKSMDAIAKVIAGKSSKKINNNSPNSQNGSKSVVYAKKSSASIETQTLPSQIAHKTTEPENTPKLPPASPRASLAAQAQVKAKSSEENFEECLPQTNYEKKPSEIESKTIPGEAAEAMIEKVTNDTIVEQSNETVENKITDTASTTTTTTIPSIPVSFAGVKENGIAESPIGIKKQNKTPSRKVSPEKRISVIDSNRGKKYAPIELKQDPHSISKKPRLWTPEVKKEENFTGRTHLQRKIDLPKRYQETSVSLPMLISPSTEAAKTNAAKKPESPVSKPKVARPALLANGTPGLKQTTEARMNGVIKKSPSKLERSRCSPSHDTYTAKGSTSEADDVDEPIDITESDFIDEKTKAKFMATSKEKEVMETVVDLIDSTLLNNHDCDTALSMINKLGSPNFVDKTILKSHPEIVEVLRKMQHFVGNPKGNRYNKAQKLELQEKSALIREAAIKTLENFKELMSTNTKPRAVLIMEEMRRQQSNSEA